MIFDLPFLVSDLVLKHLFELFKSLTALIQAINLERHRLDLVIFFRSKLFKLL